MSRFNTGNPIGSADPRDRDDNSKNLDEAVNAQADRWTDRLGNERVSLRGAVDPTGFAQSALNDANRAEAARDAAFVNADVYDDVAAGIAGTDEGEQFQVVEGAEVVRYRNESGSAVEVARYPASALVNLAVSLTSQGEIGGEFPNDENSEGVLYAVTTDSGDVLFYVNELGELVSYDAGDFEFPDDGQSTSYAVVDEIGSVLLSFDENGVLEQPNSGPVNVDRESLMPYLHEGAIRASGDGDYHIAELGQYSALSFFPGGPRSIRAVIDKPSLGSTSAVTGFVDSNVLVPDSPKVLHIVIGLGQSLMVGSNADDTLISTTQPYPQDVLMFDIGPSSDVRVGVATGGGSAGPSSIDPDAIFGFRPLVAVANPNRGQTPLESLGTELARYCRETDNVQTRRLFLACGRGGTSYDGLRKGSVPYQDMISAVTKAKELAEARGWKIIVDCAVLRHGESSSPAPEATYKDALTQWQLDVQGDLQAITGQQSNIPFLICQPSSFSGTGSAARAMARLHAESDVHHVVAADYPHSDVYADDLLHGLGGFYFLNGEYLARAFQQIMWGSEGKNKIVRMLGATRSGTSVDIDVEVPVAPLVFDSSVTERGVRGFEFFDGNGQVQIIGAAVIDTGSSGVGVVRLTLGSTPTGSEEVRYASLGHSDGRTESTIPRGQLRDSAGGVSQFDGRPLHNWAIHQSIEVEL